MTNQEWKLLIAMLTIFVIGGLIREYRKARLDPPPLLPAPSTTPSSPAPSPPHG